MDGSRVWMGRIWPVAAHWPCFSKSMYCCRTRWGSSCKTYECLTNNALVGLEMALAGISDAVITMLHFVFFVPTETPPSKPWAGNPGSNSSSKCGSRTSRYLCWEAWTTKRYEIAKWISSTSASNCYPSWYWKTAAVIGLAGTTSTMLYHFWDRTPIYVDYV